MWKGSQDPKCRGKDKKKKTKKKKALDSKRTQITKKRSDSNFNAFANMVTQGLKFESLSPFIVSN